MSRSIRISERTGRAILDLIGLLDPRRVNQAAASELRSALVPRRSVAAAAKVRGQKKRAKKSQTSDIRAAVFERAGGKCECGCGGVAFTPYDLGELDHFWGRSKERQSVENCWALCRLHHQAKTRGYPGRTDWLCAFITHAKRHGYHEQVEKAQDQLDSLVLRSEAEGVAP